jgi:hypothetical protein
MPDASRPQGQPEAQDHDQFFKTLFKHFYPELSLKYHRVSLRSLRAEEYLARDNPLGWALAVRMKRGRLRKVSLVLDSLVRIGRARLSDMKRELLLNCVMMYAKLNQTEQAELEAKMETEEYKDIDILNAEWTWSGKMRKKAREEGLQEGRKEGHREGHREGLVTSLLLIYERRLGEVPGSIRVALASIQDPHRLQELLPVFLEGSAEAIAQVVLG